MNVTLSDLGKGSLEAKFQRSLSRVVENIHDMNTEAGAKREILIKILIKPDKEDRERAEMTATCVEKLASSKPQISLFYSGVDLMSGETAAEEKVTEQPSLFQTAQPEGKIKSFEQFRAQNQG